jgi:hypothetical protein
VSPTARPEVARTLPKTAPRRNARKCRLLLGSQRCEVTFVPMPWVVLWCDK